MSYDPVEPSVLQPEQLQRARSDDALSPLPRRLPRRAEGRRLAHAGDRSPLALANREIGQLPPAAKAAAGKRSARRARRSSRRWRSASTSSGPTVTPGLLVEEAVDVTLPVGPPSWKVPGIR